jgi:hypothetical protein
MANQYTAYRFISDTQKECSMCGEIKLHSEFHLDSKNKRNKGLAYYCKTCACKNSRKHHNNRVKNDVKYKLTKKSNYLKYKYGITLEQYEEKLQKQKHCSICEIELQKTYQKEATGREANLDHNHNTGALRDFLCSNCNKGLGSFHDNIWKLKKAIAYLEKHNNSVDIVKEGSCL